MPIIIENQPSAAESHGRYISSFLEILGNGMKALVPRTRRAVPFSMLGRNNYPALGGEFDGFYGGGSPGSTYDYRTAAGELLENSVVAACVDSVGQALADAPPLLEKLVGTEWEMVPSHPVLDLLNYPNKYHNPFEIWSAVAGAEMTTGEAFWRLEWNASRTRPTEIWYERPDSMRVIGTDGEYIAKYVFRRDDGALFELDNSDVIHFRYALNPWNARRGSSPIQSGLRQIAGDNGAATFHGALLRNCAVMSLLVSVKDGQNDNTTPDQLDEFTKKLSQKLRGDNAGAIAGVNLPLDVHKMGYSPDEMALDKLISYYESRICALLRVDPMVVGLGSGTLQKTYANMGEALNDFWERRIIPTKKRHSAVLGAQLLPLFGLDPAVYRISWDYRNVAPLQENEDARHVRYREDYRAKVIDLYDAQLGLGMNPDQSMRGVFFGDKTGGDETKSLKIRDRNGAWHGDHDGRFQSHDGAGGGGAPARGNSGSGSESSGESSASNSGHGASGTSNSGSRSGGRPKRGAGASYSRGESVALSGSPGGSSGGSPEGARDESSSVSSGQAKRAFDELFDWEGDRIPDESVRLQRGKARAVGKISPFADEASKVEASAVVLVRDGKEYDFKIGEPSSDRDEVPEQVRVNRPYLEPFVLFHSHNEDESLSPKDWLNILTFSNLLQSHILTPNLILSIHKPHDFVAKQYNSEEIDALEDLMLAKAKDWLVDSGKQVTGISLICEALPNLARELGLLCRIGHRK